jgi:hypothetical protein
LDSAGRVFDCVTPYATQLPSLEISEAVMLRHFV